MKYSNNDDYVCLPHSYWLNHFCQFDYIYIVLSYNKPPIYLLMYKKKKNWTVWSELTNAPKQSLIVLLRRYKKKSWNDSQCSGEIDYYSHYYPE